MPMEKRIDNGTWTHDGILYSSEKGTHPAKLQMNPNNTISSENSKSQKMIRSITSFYRAPKQAK